MPEGRTAPVLQRYRVSTKERQFFVKNVNGGGGVLFFGGRDSGISGNYSANASLPLQTVKNCCGCT